MFPVALIFALCISNSNAQQMYIGAAGGLAIEMFDQDTLFKDMGANPDDVSNSWALYLFFGYGITERITIQADFGYFFGFGPDEEELDDADLTMWNLLASVKYYFPMEKWIPFVMGGIGWASIDADDMLIPDQDGNPDNTQSGMLMRIGGGIEYKLTDTFRIIGDIGYNFTFGDIEDWNFFDIRIGAGYNFQ